MKTLLDAKTEWRYNPKWDLWDGGEAIFGDGRLSFRARGVWVYMRSKPATWDFSASRMAEDGIEGRRAILDSLKELEGLGYLSRMKLGNGRVVYTLSGNAYIGIEPEIDRSSLAGSEVYVDDEYVEPRVSGFSDVVDFVCLAYGAYGVTREAVKDVLDREEVRTCGDAREWMRRTRGVDLVGSPDSVPF